MYTAIESEMAGQTVTLGTKVGACPSDAYTVKDAASPSALSAPGALTKPEPVQLV